MWNGIRVIPFMGRNKKYFHKISLWRKALQAIRKIHKTNPIDVVHSLWLKECALIGNYISKSLRTNHVCTAMGTDVLKNRNIYLKLLNLRYVHVVVVSDFQNQHLKASRASLNTRLIPWGIANEGTEMLKSFDHRLVDVLGVGSLSTVKDYKTFIETIKILVRDQPDLKVKIIGDGPLLNELKLNVQRHNLSDNIDFLGHLSNDVVQEYMQNSRVLLHTATFESQGYVFLEALKNGMKIVSRKVGIARQSEQWHLGDDGPSLALAVKQSLLFHEAVSFNLYPIQNTVKSYVELYRNGRIQ
jgi:glycosyltransferase involved in cell wall biosynthesis